MFVAEQCGQSGVGLTHGLTHGAVTDIDPQRQGVDEHPQGAVSTQAALHTSQQHSAEDHVFTSAGAAQHSRPGQVMQAGCTHSQLPRLSTQTLTQISRKSVANLLDTLPVTLHFKQAERQGRFIDIAEHLAEKRLVLLATHAQTSLTHVVPVRHRRRQLCCGALQVGEHFYAHHVQRGVVKGNVVEQQDCHPALVLRVLGKGQVNQRGLIEIEAVLAWIKTALQLSDDIAAVLGQGDLLHRQFDPAQSHLQRLFQPLPDQRRAQDVMAIDHRLQAFGKAPYVCRVAQGEGRLQQIRVALFSRDMVIKNAFLQRCKWVDVLHVRRATGNVGDNALDTCLVQRGEGQHVRGDVPAALGNAIGGHFDLDAAAHRRRQCSKGGLAEQDANVGTQANLAHALDQLHRQQRMTAQLEEMVLPTDPLHTQHFAPERGQRGFGVAVRRLIVATDEGIGRRLRQRTTIQLAIGRHRQFFQVHIGCRDHVIRQQCL
ncbi:Uncharacterized protein ABJ98_3678 [Pseudomonas syringae pv. aceris]|nr:Uncharacterized protein ABJ98_3678 [Pseudomonas syringae pv. aceris]